MKTYFNGVIFVLLSILFALSCKHSDFVQSHDDSLYRIYVENKYGYMNAEGRIVIDPQYERVHYKFTENRCCVELDDKRYLIDRQGNRKLELSDSISWVRHFVNGKAIFYSKNRMGIIDSIGNTVIPAVNHLVAFNSDGDNRYICVEESLSDSVYYMANMDGKIIGDKCDSILTGFLNGLCPIKQDDHWGYMDTTGNIVIDCQYDLARCFSDEGLARVRKDGKEFFIDRTGKCVIRADSTITGFGKNRAIVELNGNKCMIDKSGCIICNLDFDDIYPYDYNGEFHAALYLDGKTCLIDSLGKVLLSVPYNRIGDFKNGIAYAENNGLYGIVDETGKVLVDIKYDDTNRCDASYNIVSFVNTIDGFDYYSYFDSKGNLIWQDIPSKKLAFPSGSKRTKSECMKYFDANISTLDPIEGIYYYTEKSYYQGRDDINKIGLNSSSSDFFAVVKSAPKGNEYHAFCMKGDDSMWLKKFVRLGNTNKYAIVGWNENSDFASDGQMTLDDPNQFEFRLEADHNTWYNFFMTYEFVRDYPPLEDYQMYQRVDWTGTGFAIADGYIVTNYHVTNGAKMIRVKGVNGDFETSYSGYLVASDKENDLSVIKIVDSAFDGFGEIPYPIGKTTVDVGEHVFVLGYPMTSTMGNEIKLTDGIISSLSGFKGDESMYQISAAAQPGNSGGPLFNESGNVIGVVCGKHPDAENANYAIKISYLYDLINESDIPIHISDNHSMKSKKITSKVKKIKNYVYLLECSGK